MSMESLTTHLAAALMQLHRSVLGVGGRGVAVASQAVPTDGHDCRAVLVGVYESLFVPEGVALAMCAE